MKLDHTFIAIRERGILEICDLGLHVVRDHFKPLLILLFAGALPWIIVDWLITYWLVTGVYRFEYTPMYYWLAFLLISSQAQVGTSFVTYYLGQAMFVGRPGIIETVRGALKTSFYFWWVHGILRLVFPILFFAWLTMSGDEDTLVGIGVLLLPMMLGAAWLVRALRPFVSEILMLEKTPIRSSDKNRISFSSRSANLHAAGSSDLLGRAMLTGLFCLPMGFSIFANLVVIDSVLNLQANSEVPLYAFYWIAALWLTAGFAAVIRFLSYVDTRIRQEGWAVELKMRAEGQRILGAIE
jgi:hypothetical protein